MDKTRAAYFSPNEQQLLMETYEEVKHIICKKGNTAAVIKQRENAWQTIADRLNATNMSGQKRTWQQVKIKYKNILQAAIKKKSHITGTGGGPPTQDFTPAEELALDLNKGKPVIEGIQGGTATDSGPARDTGLFIQLAGNTLTLLDPPDYDLPREATSTAVECTSADDETVSLDSRRLEDPDIGQSDKQPGNINSQTVRYLYTTHLKRQIELSEVKIDVNKRKLQYMDLDMQIKRKTLRKLELEIQKLQTEVSDFSSYCNHDCNPMY
ncbi:uncharacterized protein Hap1MRO34_006915 isoform 1-T1 [Clarias gariepinus]